MRWNINNEVDNVTSPSLSLTTLQTGRKYYTILHDVTLLSVFVCLWNNSACSTFQTIQRSSKYLSDFLIIRSEGMSVLGCTTIFCDVVSLGSKIFL